MATERINGGFRGWLRVSMFDVGELRAADKCVAG